MIQTVPDILARIVDHKKAELTASSGQENGWKRKAAERTEYRNFRAALQSTQPAIIAEIKKASPSRGLLAEDFDPITIARAYAAGGAGALSVLTDQAFFQGSLLDLEQARSAVTVPVLRKDFTIDAIQVLEAAAHGADAILLIAAILTRSEMRHLRETAAELGLAALVEVHDRRELDEAIESGAEILGVNNRNLHTFQVTLETSLELAPHIPDDVVKVSESGIHSKQDIETLQAAGFEAFLVGEHLMKAGNPTEALRALMA